MSRGRDRGGDRSRSRVPEPPPGLTQLWRDVDAFAMGGLLAPGEDPVAASERGAAAGLPAIEVSAAQGKLLHLLVRLAGARRVLEIGTLAGYSTTWLARAVPADGGRVVSLELDPHHAEVARRWLVDAGLDERVEVVVGPAAESLPRLVAEGAGPFDVVFVDADKRGSRDYVAWALQLTRPGSLVVVDNVVRGGAVLDGGSDDPSVVGARELLAAVAAEPRLSSTVVQTVGAKGYDGLLVAVVGDGNGDGNGDGDGDGEHGEG